MDSNNTVEVSSLECRYGERVVLDNVSLTAKGTVLALIGPNGSGKSSLLKAIGGLLPVSKGGIRIGSESINRLTTKELARRISFVPQEEPILFDFKSIDIVLMGRLAKSEGIWDTAEDRSIAQQAMEFTNTWELRDRPITELSGGERQRVLIARAIAQETPIMLLDEPFTHLDIHYQVQVIDLIRRLGMEGRTILIAMHDLAMLSMACDQALLLERGTAVLVGGVEDVLNAKELDRVYAVEFSRIREEHGTIVLPKRIFSTS